MKTRKQVAADTSVVSCTSGLVIFHRRHRSSSAPMIAPEPQIGAAQSSSDAQAPHENDSMCR
jgi:hypothetical protein